MSSLLSLLLLSLPLLVLVLPLLPSASAGISCPTPLVSGHLNDPTYSGFYSFNADEVKLTPIVLTVAQTVISLSLQVEGGGDSAHDISVVLGLYQATSPGASTYTLLGYTSPYVVPATENLQPFILTSSLLTSVPVSAGTYYLGRLASFSGLILYGDGVYTGAGEPYTYDAGSMPTTLTDDFNSTEVRGAITGCPCQVTGDPVCPTPHAHCTRRSALLSCPAGPHPRCPCCVALCSRWVSRPGLSGSRAGQ